MIAYLRHCQTDYNKQDRFQGRIDIPLNKDGEKEARKFRPVFEQENFDVIYCSPLSRVIKTAEIINQNKKIPIIIDNRINEIEMGVLEGKNKQDFPPDIIDKIIKNPSEYQAESAEKIWERIKDFCDEITQINKNILIVSHGGVFFGLYKYFENKNLKSSQIPHNAQYVVLYAKDAKQGSEK